MFLNLLRYILCTLPPPYNNIFSSYQSIYPKLRLFENLVLISLLSLSSNKHSILVILTHDFSTTFSFRSSMNN